MLMRLEQAAGFDQSPLPLAASLQPEVLGPPGVMAEETDEAPLSEEVDSVEKDACEAGEEVPDSLEEGQVDQDSREAEETEDEDTEREDEEYEDEGRGEAQADVEEPDEADELAALHRRLQRHRLTWPAPTALDMEDHLSRAHDIVIFWFFEARDRTASALPDWKPSQEVLEAIPEYPPDWPQWRIDSFELRQAAQAGRARPRSVGKARPTSAGNTARAAAGG